MEEYLFRHTRLASFARNTACQGSFVEAIQKEGLQVGRCRKRQNGLRQLSSDHLQTWLLTLWRDLRVRSHIQKMGVTDRELYSKAAF